MSTEQMIIETIECTCCGCPTQYDIYLTDGRYVYFRYRWGSLYIELEGKVIYDWEDDSGGWSGIMGYSDVLTHLRRAGITF